MKEYHKIQTIFKRDPETKFKTLLMNEYSIPEFEYLKDNEWVFTEKVDGTNIRIMFDGEEITYGGKTDNAMIPADLLNNLIETFDPLLLKMKISFPDGVCFYGEGYGAKIQKGGGNYSLSQKFVLFDIKIGEWWLKRMDVEIISEDLKIDIVPIIGIGTIPQMVKMVKSGFGSTWGDFQAEGIVARPRTELKTRNGKRIITKLKIKDFK